MNYLFIFAQEKSRFKKSEQIEEDLETHTKGKNS